MAGNRPRACFGIHEDAYTIVFQYLVRTMPVNQRMDLYNHICNSVGGRWMHRIFPLLPRHRSRPFCYHISSCSSPSEWFKNMRLLQLWELLDFDSTYVISTFLCPDSAPTFIAKVMAIADVIGDRKYRERTFIF